MHKGAILSDCGTFRYRLWRYWEPLGVPRMLFVMLNPSTADADTDDPTIRKCRGFAEDLDFGGIEVVNLYAYRATKPADLKKAGYPRGPDNDRHIREAIEDAGGSNVYCAWGVNARGLSRPDEVLDLIRAANRKPMALKLTEDRIPWHPLMLPYSSQPVPL